MIELPRGTVAFLFTQLFTQKDITAAWKGGRDRSLDEAVAGALALADAQAGDGSGATGDGA